MADDRTPRDNAPSTGKAGDPPQATQPTVGVLDGETYTAADFLEGTRPFEAVYKFHGSAFEENRMLERMVKVAQALKVQGFKKMYGSYLKSLKQAAGGAEADNVTQFEQQEAELVTGDWTADDTGVWKYGSYGSYEIACTHPIMPVERLKNIDTGELKVRLRFRRGTGGRKVWSEILTDFDTVSNAKNIVKLSQIGISVTSGKRAQNLVDYLADVMDLNYDSIPERRSVSRLGWNEEGFSPYVDGVVFDGNPGFVKTYEAIRPRGSFEKWLEVACAARKHSVAARIVLSASFASALIKPLGILPFFVHLWGMDSGTGKSVAQMLAASVWGNPQIGGPFFPTFKSTSVGFEVIAGFLGSLPVFIDELQLAKDNRGKLIFNVYELASGAGKLRSNKSLGLASTPTWANCFITSGESPLTGENDGAGALNRVIEIECKADAKVIDDGHGMAQAVRENYGHAGKAFIARVAEPEALNEVKEIYEATYAACMRGGTTEKQALAAAIVVTADYFATDWIFKDGASLSVEQIDEFLKSREQVSAAARGYAYMCDWVAQHANSMRAGMLDGTGEVLGKIEIGERGHEWAYVIKSVFFKACADAGISAPALLGHLKSRNLIQTRGRALTKGKRINNVLAECVVMKLPSETLDDLETTTGPTPFDAPDETSKGRQAEMLPRV